MGVNLFISYASEDSKFKTNFEKHLKVFRRKKVINTWSNTEIVAGEEQESAINLAIGYADIIALLISADFIDADYCYESEMIMALERYNKGEVEVIPIILRHCQWLSSEIGHLKALPENQIPIAAWKDEDEAWSNICSIISDLATKINRKKQESGVVEIPDSNDRSIVSAHAIYVPSIKVMKQEISVEYPGLKTMIEGLLCEAQPDHNDRVKDKMATTLVHFLKIYRRWYFSPLRIVKWGGKQSGYENLKHFDSKVLGEILRKLEESGIVSRTLSKRGNPLFRIVSSLQYKKITG